MKTFYDLLADPQVGCIYAGIDLSVPMKVIHDATARMQRRVEEEHLRAIFRLRHPKLSEESTMTQKVVTEPGCLPDMTPPADEILNKDHRACRVVRIDRVEDHPKADRLTLNHIGDKVVISNRKEDGSARYAAGDQVVFVPPGAILPEWVMKKFGYWDEARNCGFLDGDGHNTVAPRKLRGLETQGLILPCEKHVVYEGPSGFYHYMCRPKQEGDHEVYVNAQGEYGRQVLVDEDVTSFLGITWST